jgi:hypothetical protein
MRALTYMWESKLFKQNISISTLVAEIKEILVSTEGSENEKQVTFLCALALSQCLNDKNTQTFMGYASPISKDTSN